jgi:uncharacterized protein YabN with tetrapyrrole methylase and pyrophosphatase domain
LTPAGEDPAAGPSDGAIQALTRLDEITRRLRRECPWDREQDERSIVPHTVEEAYELADAAGRGDDAKLLDELGDVLFQVHFLALLLEERGAGDLAAVADGMVTKLIRRHPHVFEESEARELLEGDPKTAREVLSNWDRIKQEVEGRGAGDPFADVPSNLPALLYARKVQRRAASAGLGDRQPGGRPETTAQRDAGERRIGAGLFDLVDEARRLGVDPELALRAETERFRDEAGDSR